MGRTKTGKIVKCSRCGKKVYKPKVFLSKHKRHFCDINCWNEQQYEEATSRKKATCFVCGRNFMSKGKINKFNGKKYWDITCSVECRRKRETAEAFYKKCEYCGKRIRCYGKNKDRKRFCSKECAGSHKTFNNTFKDVCLSCGKDLVIQGSKSTSAGNYYCSKKCMDGYRKALNSPSWKGGWYLDHRGVIRINVGMSKKKYKGHPYGHPVYRARYRVVIELATGQFVPRNKPVLHLNGDMADDRISNLYICTSPTELGQFMQGVKSFPLKSNVGYEAMKGKIDYLRHDNASISQFINDSLAQQKGKTK